jgi:hypothetical protein
VVTAVKVDPLGNGEITIMEQNALAGGVDQINVQDWKETYGSKGYAGGYFYYDHISWLELVPDVAPSTFVYSVRSLGPAAAAAGSINAAGQVAGRSSRQSSRGKQARHVFIYSHGKMSLLNSPVASADPTGRAALNDFGAIAVTTSTGRGRSTAYAVGTRSGVHWHALEAISGSQLSATLGINNRGDVSGWVAKRGARSPTSGVVWVHKAGSYIPRILSPNRYFNSPLVYASDTTGDAVGSEMLGTTKTFGVIWLPSGKGLRLPDLTIPPGFGSAVAMESHGSSTNRLLSIAGMSRDVNAMPQACEWTVKILGSHVFVGVPQSVAQLSGYRSSESAGMNAAGWVTGSAITTTGKPTAFLWRPGIGAVDVNSLLKSGSGWRIVRASAINSAGQIVAQGYFRGSTQSRNVILNPVAAA